MNKPLTEAENSDPDTKWMVIALCICAFELLTPK